MSKPSSTSASKDATSNPEEALDATPAAALPGLAVFRALQGADIPSADQLAPRHAAVLAAFAAASKGDDAELWTVDEAREWAFTLKKGNPMAWGAARVGDLMRFTRVTKAGGSGPTTAQALQAAVANILAAKAA